MRFNPVVAPPRRSWLRGLAVGLTLTVLPFTAGASAAAAPAPAVAPVAPSAAAPGILSVRTLTTESRGNPLGVDVDRPRLGWILGASTRGAAQSAYRIQVASTRARLDAGNADVWDSGRVGSSASTQVAYAGPGLASATRYHWRVQVWDTSGTASTWSPAAWWETGLLTASDWSARWVSPTSTAPGGSYLRSASFDVPAGFTSARLYVSGRGNYERGSDGQGICCEQQFGLARGIYEPFLNGERVSSTEIESTSVDTRVRALYRTYDVTDQVISGANTLGMMIGEDSDVLAQLVVTKADGEKVTIGSSADWTWAPGPVTRAHRFHGEQYDARREIASWSTGGTQGTWTGVRVAAGSVGRLDAAKLEPIEVVRDHRAVAITEPAPGVHVLDFGQNRSGWTRLRASLPAGATVTLKHGERLSGGRVDNGIIGARQTMTYTAAAAGEVDWEPSFVYSGFRWVEVTGLPTAPTAETVVAREAHNDVASTGTFTAADPQLNRLHTANRQTQVNGMHQVPEDTPTREKRGWTADAHIAAEALINNWGMESFYENFADESVAAQRPDGRVPDIVPTEPSDGWRDRSDPAWAASHILIPAYLHRKYADARVLVENYDSLKAYVDYVETTTDGDLVTSPTQTWGNDWLAVESTDSRLFRSGFYQWMLTEMVKAARLAGKPADAADFGQRADRVARAINATFLDEENQTYGPSQFANAFPLTLGIVPAQHVEGVVETLVEDVVEERGNHFTGGLPGIKYIPEALAMHGRSDVVLDVVRNNEHPGWGYMLDNGPGTIWEDWNGASSLNHPMFTSIDNWFYDSVAGLRQTPDSVGYRSSVIDPQVTDRVPSGKASLQTPYGLLSSGWSRDRGRQVQEVTVPVNTTAQVHVQTTDLRAVLEGNAPLAGRPGIRSARRVGDSVVVTVGSGSYRFVVDPDAGRLFAAREALRSQLTAIRKVRPASRRVLLPPNRKARAAVAASIQAHNRAQNLPRQRQAAIALGRVDRTLQQTRRLHRQRKISVRSDAAIRRHGRVARRELSAVVAAHRRIEVTPQVVGALTAGSSSEVTVQVRNLSQRPMSSVRVGLQVPAGWQVTRLRAAPRQVKAGGTGTARYRVAVPAGQRPGAVDLVARLDGVHRGSQLLVLGATMATVQSAVEVTGVLAVPRVVEVEDPVTTVRTTVRNRGTSAVQVTVRPRQVPEGWTMAETRTTIPPSGTVDIDAPLRRGPDGSPGGRVAVEVLGNGQVWGAGSTAVYVRDEGCAADPRDEACLTTDVRLLYSFEDDVEGWVAGENTSVISSVTAMANGPGGPLLGSRLLEAQSSTSTPANAWRTVSVDLPRPVTFAPGEDLAVALNSYGGAPSGPYQARIVAFDSAGERFEHVATVTPDSWNRVRASLADWAGVDIARLEVSFRANGASGWAGRFQIDQVALDSTPLPPDPATSLSRGAAVASSGTLACCGWSPAAMVDGQRVSTPASRGFTTDPGAPSANATRWVQVDLGATKPVGSVWLWPRTATAGEATGVNGASFPEDFTIQLSDDGTTWTTGGTFTGETSDGSTGRRFEVEGSGRYVRVNVTRLGRSAPDEAGTNFRIQLAELEVYAP